MTEIRVLAVGRFTERKGFHCLMQAANQLMDLNLRFMFVGFGDLNLREMEEGYGLSDWVTVFGKMDQEQLRDIYQLTDILCVPSTTTAKEGAEGIPLVLMEDMACGLPVAATRCGVIDEIVEEILVDEASPEQLAAGIRGGHERRIATQAGRAQLPHCRGAICHRQCSPVRPLARRTRG